jgi:hypothetical protein
VTIMMLLRRRRQIYHEPIADLRLMLKTSSFAGC